MNLIIFTQPTICTLQSCLQSKQCSNSVIAHPLLVKISHNLLLNPYLSIHIMVKVNIVLCVSLSLFGRIHMENSPSSQISLQMRDQITGFTYTSTELCASLDTMCLELINSIYYSNILLFVWLSVAAYLFFWICLSTKSIKMRLRPNDWKSLLTWLRRVPHFIWFDSCVLNVWIILIPNEQKFEKKRKKKYFNFRLCLCDVVTFLQSFWI